MNRPGPGATAALFDALVAEVTAAVLEKLRGEVHSLGWVRHDRSPLGSRMTRALCVRGEFPSARKVGRRWFVRSADIDAYIASHPGSQRRERGADGGEGVGDVLRELGLRAAGGRK